MPEKIVTYRGGGSVDRQADMGYFSFVVAEMLQQPRQIGLLEAYKRSFNTASPDRALLADNQTYGLLPALQSMGTYSRVDEYIRSHGLGGFLDEANRKVAECFGASTTTELEILSDPADGSEMLFVQIPSGDMKTGRRLFSRFCYDWWYDQVGQFGHIVGFRIVKGIGL